ncbi:MAG: preprotein translocase subunit YajC [Lachnospiraceae bacterium]|nr:preprotein translocase subunit YajC [Lachnospiraceae bacterium]
MTVLMLVGWLAIMYFLLIRPQKKQQKQMDELRNAIQAGDNIMTTGGFYGVVLDVVDDTVIVEFGNNKNCRIPMHKNAIAEVQKADEEIEE